MDKNKHLDSIISTLQLTKEETLFDKYVKKENEIKQTPWAKPLLPPDIPYLFHSSFSKSGILLKTSSSSSYGV